MSTFGITFRRAADFDVDKNFALVGAREEDIFEPLRYDLFKRITTPGLSYDFTDRATEWIDIRSFLGSTLSTDTIAARITAAIEGDERVSRVIVTVAETVENELRSLEVKAEVETAEGPFEFVVSAAGSLVKLLES